MKHSAVALLLTVLATPAMALDGYIAEAGGGEGVHSVRIGMIRQWDQQWFSEGHWHVTGYWEASLGQLSSDRADGHSAADLAFTPVFRLRPNASGGAQPYWDIALGLHLLSSTRLDHKHAFSSAVQFGPLVGVGVTFGEKSQYDLGYRFQHLTNANVSQPNPDLNLHLVRLTYLY